MVDLKNRIAGVESTLSSQEKAPICKTRLKSRVILKFLHQPCRAVGKFCPCWSIASRESRPVRYVGKQNSLILLAARYAACKLRRAFESQSWDRNYLLARHRDKSGDDAAQPLNLAAVRSRCATGVIETMENP
jgi:hypothetical protein